MVAKYPVLKDRPVVIELTYDEVPPKPIVDSLEQVGEARDAPRRAAVDAQARRRVVLELLASGPPVAAGPDRGKTVRVLTAAATSATIAAFA